jgi:hypothetical protein
MIFILLEKHNKLTIETLSELLEGIDPLYVANECNGLIYNHFNPKKSGKGGLIVSNAQEGKDLTPKDTIEINGDFQAPTLKLSTIPVGVVVKAGQKDNNEEIKKLYMRNIIDSTIIRILKGRIGQESPHAQVVSEVVKQIDMFQAQPPAIKERIESLIEGGYVKRQQNNRNNYEYIA